MLGQAKQSSGMRRAPDCPECISSISELICVMGRVELISEGVQELDAGIEPQFPSLGNGYHPHQVSSLELWRQMVLGAETAYAGSRKRGRSGDKQHSSWEKSKMHPPLYHSTVRACRPERAGAGLRSHSAGELRQLQ